MSLQPEISRAEHLHQLFLALHAIMSAEGEANWIRGVRGILAVLVEVEANPSTAADRIAEARETYRSMNGGNGSFSDFHIWRENFDERVTANNELSRITGAIWQVFETDA
jgi:hypothetical protein